MRRAIVWWGVSALLAWSAGCAVDSVTVPAPTGPSEMSTSLTMAVTPDLIRQDGFSTATISLHARDAVGLPIAGLTVRLDILVGSTMVDYGTLSHRTVFTAADGKAATIYQSPSAPPASAQNDTTVTIRATMVGTNYQNTLPRTAELRLVRPGVILPPNGAPVPSFFVSPSTGRENEPLMFDASASADDGQIVSYSWSFGDGDSGSGRVVSHTYELAGTYLVTLTVTDDRGQRTSSAPTPVTITAAANPVASFTVSPTDPRAGTPLVFNAASSTVPTGRTITGFNWEFGDGTVAEGPAPHHSYAVAGTYTVTLVVTDNTGRKGVASRTVTVLPRS
jgi:PKD repeat protein